MRILAICFLFASGFFLSLPSQADESVLLAEIISEPEGGLVHSLFMISDEHGSFVRLLRHSRVDEQKISPEELMRGDVVVAKSDGRDALLLSARSCNLLTGGDFTMKFLYNGIFMTYHSVDLKLAHEANGWVLRTASGVKVETLRLVSNTLFGHVIGIEDVLVNAPR